jgi:dCMP deaminase
MIVNAGIKRVVYEEGYPDDFSLEILNESGVELERYEVQDCQGEYI